MDATCPLCLDLCNTPYSTACCGKIFCHNCIQRPTSCPMCRYAPLRITKSPSRVQDIINDIIGRCSSCGTSMTCLSFALHAFEECTYPCPAGCGQQLTRNMHFSHLKLCDVAHNDCRGKLLGYTAQLLNRDVAAHEKLCKYVYAIPYVDTISTFSEELIRLKKYVNAQRDIINHLQQGSRQEKRMRTMFISTFINHEESPYLSPSRIDSAPIRTSIHNDPDSTDDDMPDPIDGIDYVD